MPGKFCPEAQSAISLKKSHYKDFHYFAADGLGSMALASFMTSNRLLAFAIGCAALAAGARQAAVGLGNLRSGAADLEWLTSSATGTTLTRMGDRLHAINSDPVVQKNLQWKYFNSLSQTLAAAVRPGEAEHLAIVDSSCNAVASSNRQVVGSGDHWKPVCPQGFSASKPFVFWHSKNGTPVLQVSIPFSPALAIVAQTPMSDTWLRQHPRLLAHMRREIPESTFVLKEDAGRPQWTPLSWKLRLGARISESTVRTLDNLSTYALLLALTLLGVMYMRFLWRAREEGLMRERNQRTLGQLIAGAASDDEAKLSFAPGYASSSLTGDGDLTPEMISLDRLHRNRYAMSRLDMKEKDLWIEDLEAQLADMRAELDGLRLESLSLAQQRLVQEGVTRKLADACQVIAGAHDDLLNYSNEPLIALSNLAASWKQGSQTMGLKRFTRLLQESTDQLNRRSELESAVLAVTSIHERAFSTVFELPVRLKQSLQDIRPAISRMGGLEVAGDARLATSSTLGDALDDSAAMISLARPGQKTHVRLLQSELRTARVSELVSKALGKWFFYRALESMEGIPSGSIVYLNLRGKKVGVDRVELVLSVVTSRDTAQTLREAELCQDRTFLDAHASELANRLAISVGIDWADKKNTGSRIEPASSTGLTIRVPLLPESERRESTSAVVDSVGAGGMDMTQAVERDVRLLDFPDHVAI
ncbi:MAG: hypothetical protein RIQ81_1641 [Pseudomonadota bacterium]